MMKKKMKDYELKGRWVLFLDGVSYLEITKVFLLAGLNRIVDEMDRRLIIKPPREYPNSKRNKVYIWNEIRELVESLYYFEYISGFERKTALAIIEQNERKKWNALIELGKPAHVLTSTGVMKLISAPTSFTEIPLDWSPKKALSLIRKARKEKGSRAVNKLTKKLCKEVLEKTGLEKTSNPDSLICDFIPDKVYTEFTKLIVS